MNELPTRPALTPRRFTPTPSPSDLDKKATARILKTQSWAIVAAGLLVGGAGPLLVGMSWRWLLLPGLLVAIGLVTFLLARRGLVTGGAHFLITSIWVFVTIAAWTGGGLEAPIIGTQLVVVVLAGLLLSWRASLVAAVAAVATVFLLAWAETAGRLPEPSVAHTQWSQALVLIIVIILMTQAVAVAVWNRQRASQGALRELERRAAAEAELAQSRAMLSAVIEGTSDAVFIKDLEGRYLYVNKAAEDMFELRAEDVLGRDVAVALPLEQAVGVTAADKEVLAAGRPVTREQLLTPGGTPRWFLTTRGPLTLADGTVIGTFSISRDITERRLTQDRMRATLDSLLDPHVLVEAIRDETGRIVDFLYLEANEAAAHAMGQERDRLVGAQLSEVLPNAGNSDLTRLWIEAVNTGAALIVDDFVLANALLHENRYYDIRGVRVGDGLSFTWRDVTERHEMAAALRRRIDELDALQRISKLLAESDDLPQALGNVCRQVQALLAAGCVQIRTLPTRGEAGAVELEMAAATAECGDEPGSPAEPVVREVLQAGRPVAVSATPGERQLLVPMMAGDAAIGLLIVTRRQHDPFSAQEGRIAQPIADALAAAIENQRLHEQEKRQAAADERRRIARNLHDAVMQTIIAANAVADAMPSTWERSHEEGLHELESLRRLVQAALAEMRILLYELRPGTLEVTPLDALLARLGEALGGHAVLDIELSVAPDLELPHEVKLALYRIAQEALDNIGSHAEATEVSISAGEDVTGVRLTVRDDGRGFAPDTVPGETAGLPTMREEARKIGATLAVESVVGRGTTVRVTWPRPQPSQYPLIREPAAAS